MSQNNYTKLTFIFYTTKKIPESSSQQQTMSSSREEEFTTTATTTTLTKEQAQQISTSATLASAHQAISSTVNSITQKNQQQSKPDDFENLNRAVQILGKAKQLDDIKRYDEALKMYRQGIDMLLEELIIRPGTEQSRTYLRNKCNDFMNRIDQLKLIIQIEKTNKEIAAKKEAAGLKQ